MTTPAHPRTPAKGAKEKADVWDDFGMASEDDNFEPPPGQTRKARTPLTPTSPNTGRLFPGRQPRAPRKRVRSDGPDGSQDTEDEEEEEGEEEEKDPRELLGPSSGKRIFKGRIEEGSSCPPHVADKIRERVDKPPVGTHLLMMATSDMEGGLRGAIERADGLVGFETLYKDSGAEISIDHGQIGGRAEALEATIGECNNRHRNFHEAGADVHTARVHRALRAAVSLTSADRPLFGKKSNGGGCEQTVDVKGTVNCRLNKEYPKEQLEAARQIENALYEKVSQDCPGARILMVQRFGDYSAKKHTTQDGKPLVTRMTVGELLVVLSVRGVHFCQMPGSPIALRSNVEGRLALKAHAARELGRREDYTDAEVRKGMLDLLEILATGEEESAEYRARLDPEKTSELVGLVDGLREESLEEIVDGAKEFGESYEGRRYTAESASEGGRNGDKKKAEGGKKGGAMSTGVNNNSIGAGPNENKAAQKRENIPVDAGDEGAEETSNTPAFKTPKERGLCLGLSADGKGLASKLQTSIDLDTGAILVDPPLWCDTPKFGERGLTLGKSKWQDDGSGNLVLGLHNTNGRDEHPRCQVGGTVPVVWDKVGEKWLVPEWALRYIKAGKVVQRNTNNTRHNGASEKQRAKKKARNVAGLVVVSAM